MCFSIKSTPCIDKKTKVMSHFENMSPQASYACHIHAVCIKKGNHLTLLEDNPFRVSCMLINVTKETFFRKQTIRN